MSRRAPVRPADSATLSREAWTLFMQFLKSAKQNFLTELELTPAQAHLLFTLDPDRPVPMSEVAVTLGCDASNVTGLVDRLEERGYIERRAATEDRRVKMVAVTGLGGKQRAKLLDRWYEAPPPIAQLPQRDLKELLRILRKATDLNTPAP